MTVYILCTVVKYEIWFCCCYSCVLVQHGTSCVNLRMVLLLLFKSYRVLCAFKSWTRTNYYFQIPIENWTELPTAQQALYGESQNNLREVYRVQQPNNALWNVRVFFFFKGVNFNNHYRVLGDKEKIISVCDFIITCQAIF